MKVITEGKWWTAIWNDVPPSQRKEELFVDIAAPAEWIGDTVRMIDLDLDLARWSDGTVEILDEDEFADHQVALGYPERLIDNARTTTARLYLDVLNRTEPFGEIAEDWMTTAKQLDRPPL